MRIINGTQSIGLRENKAVLVRFLAMVKHGIKCQLVRMSYDFTR